MVRKFKKKPVVIEAVQYTGDNLQEVIKFIGNITSLEVNSYGGGPVICVRIHTLEGVMKASPQDWVIKGMKGEFYPCKPDIFAEIYEEVKGE